MAKDGEKIKWAFLGEFNQTGNILGCSKLSICISYHAYSVAELSAG